MERSCHGNTKGTRTLGRKHQRMGRGRSTSETRCSRARIRSTRASRLQILKNRYLRAGIKKSLQEVSKFPDTAAGRGAPKWRTFIISHFDARTAVRFFCDARQTSEYVWNIDAMRSVCSGAGDISGPPATRLAIAKRESRSIAERRVSDEADDAVAARVVITRDGCCNHGHSGHGACHGIGRVLLIESRR